MSAAGMAKTGTEAARVRPVRTPSEKRSFIDLPYTLHRAEPHWVPQLRLAQKDILNTARHPFYHTSEVELFLAARHGRTVGRVMAILNRAHNEFHQEQAGFFGFFEVEDDSDAVNVLLEAAAEWLRERGAQVMRGPVSPSTNYECGLLVEGFDLDPAVMMPYNPPYYSGLIEGAGLRKAMDLFAYSIDVDSFKVEEKLKRVARRLKSKDRISIRTVDLKRLDREVEVVRQIYNNAWRQNWGFVPPSEAEFQHLAKDLKQLVDPSIVYIAEQEVDGGEKRPIAFFLAVPDINRALKRVPDGRLFPFGLPRLLWYSRRISSIRIITMGVVKEYQSMGIAAMFYDEIYRQAVTHWRYTTGEMSWVLENNLMMNRAAALIGGRRSKTYRIYEKPL